MKGKIKYTDEPMGKVKVINDFLPSPEELALKEETVKVTISLSRASVDFFKNEAKKYNTQYQKVWVFQRVWCAIRLGSKTLRICLQI